MRLDKKILGLLLMSVVFSGCMHLKKQVGVVPVPNQGIELAEDEIPVDGQDVSAKVQDYSRIAFDAARASGKTILVYFEANWCPTCRAQKPINNEAFAELVNDDNLVIFVANYKDSEETQDDKDIQKELGVPYQHTFVIINSAGGIAYSHTGQLSSEQIVTTTRSIINQQ